MSILTVTHCKPSNDSFQFCQNLPLYSCIWQSFSTGTKHIWTLTYNVFWILSESIKLQDALCSAEIKQTYDTNVVKNIYALCDIYFQWSWRNFSEKPQPVANRISEKKALIKQHATISSQQPLFLLLNKLQCPKILLQIILDFSYEKLFQNMTGLLWKLNRLCLVKKIITCIITSNIQLF